MEQQCKSNENHTNFNNTTHLLTSSSAINDKDTRMTKMKKCYTRNNLINDIQRQIQNLKSLKTYYKHCVKLPWLDFSKNLQQTKRSFSLTTLNCKCICTNTLKFH